MTTYATPPCLWCRHYHEHEFGLKCDAFPNGIPERVLAAGRHDHRMPYQRNDIVYEMREGHGIAPAIPCDERRYLEGERGAHRCAAFPRGIPYEVFSAAAHDEPLPGQGNDIVFEPKEKE